MESELRKIQKANNHNFQDEMETKELKLLSESDFFKYLPEKTKRKINQVLSESERRVK